MLDIRTADDHNASMTTGHTHPAQSSDRCSIRPVIACALFAAGMLAFAMTTEPEPTGTPTAEPAPMSAQPTDPAETDDAAGEGLLECVVTMKTGRQITGFLIESLDDSIVIRLEGIDTTYRRKNIETIEFLRPVSERYEDLRDHIEDTDIETRLILVEWLRTREAYRLALKELESILEIAPDYPEAKTLHTWMKAFLDLKSKSKSRESRTRDRAPEPSRAEDPGPPLLTAEQINLIRIYELDLRNPPRLIVHDETIQKLMAREPDKFPVDADDRDAFLKLSEPDKLKLLFTHRARDLYHEVEILEDPAMLEAFRDTVHARNGWLLNACASTRCHGGEEAGSFRLVNQNPNSTETAYTNFYIIDHFKLKDGTPLLDLNNPERSPLLQFATRPTNALLTHPEVPLERPGARYRPIFRSSRDRKFQQAVDWIRSIYRPRVPYDIGYPPPAPEPAETVEEPIPSP